MRGVLTVVMLLSLSGMASAQSPEGLWRTEKTPKGVSLDVRIASCGADLCGTIEAAYGTDRTDLVGEKLILGMRPAGEGHWADGEIVAPDSKIFPGEMWIDGDGLRVQGCRLIVCRSQVWERLD